MSTESAILLELQEVNKRLARIEARLDAISPTPWPDRMNTTEGVLYIRHAYRRPKFCAGTLYRCLKEGRLSDIAKPRRWLRTEIDALLGGVPHPPPGRKDGRGVHSLQIAHGRAG
jgi:hypothetical protein